MSSEPTQIEQPDTNQPAEQSEARRSTRARAPPDYLRY